MPVQQLKHEKKGILGKLACLGLFLYAFLASYSMAQESELANFTAEEQDSLGVFQDSSAVDSLDVHQASLDSAKIDSNVVDSNLVAADSLKDSLANSDRVVILADSVKSETAVSKASRKTVLYLDGSSRSAWFDLGVLYAFETYGVHVDSIVGNSYAAWIAALWKSGYSLDEIQRVLRQPDVERFLSCKNEACKNEAAQSEFLPLAESGIPAARARLVLSFDSGSDFNVRSLPLHMDTLALAKKRARLRIEESLYRRKLSTTVSVVACDGSLRNGAEAILLSMPFEGNLQGAGCQMPLPIEGDKNETIIVSPQPLRSPFERNVEYIAYSKELDYYKESAVVIRPLQEPVNSPEAWIQSGFSEVEKKLSVLSSMLELRPYTSVDDSTKPWFRYVATPDSIDSELQQHLMSYWNENDTGFVAIDNFLERASESAAYESVDLKLQPNGNVLMRARAPLQLDLKAGGFGDNTLGAFAYADARVRYVNQFEYELGTSVFYGMGGYGVIPELKLMRMLEGRFGFSISYEFMKLSPLSSYLLDESVSNRIYEERRGDLKLSFEFIPDESRRLSLSALVGNREYVMHEYISKSTISAKPLIPKLEYEQRTPKFEKWFGENGYDILGSLGMESVGATFGYGESVPIFWKFSADVNGNVSPVDFFTVGGGAAFGANMYREEGHDYPPSFGFAPIDLTIRQGIEATPWSALWYNPEFRSHQYGVVRANMGLHKGAFGAWVFAAFVRDFENENREYSGNRLVLEPALRFAYKSLTAYVGMNRTVNLHDFVDFFEFDDYNYFVRIGNFCF